MGYVLDMTTEKPLVGAKVDLHTVSDYKSIVTSLTDSAGHFTFQNIKAGMYSLSCFYKMTAPRMFLQRMTNDLGRSDVDSSFTVSSEQTHYYTFHLMVSCPYDKTKDLNYCPNCKKSDMTQPIFWGLPAYDGDGNSSLNDNYYFAGCSPDIWCNPTKHCKRCNIDF